MPSTLKRLIVANYVLLMCAAASTALGDLAKIRLPSGTVVPVRLEQVVDPNVLPIGSQVQAVVPINIQVEGRTVIRAGTIVIANVEEAQKSGSIGKGASVTVVVRSVQAVDGTNIPLSGSFRSVGESKEGSTVALGALLCPLFLLREGDDTMIAAGAETRAITLGDTIIMVPPEAQ